MRRRFGAAARAVACALAGCLTAAGAGAQPAAGDSAAGPVPLVLVSIDGLKPEHVRDADRLGLRVPALRALARAGARADGVVGVVPTVTYPSHVTLVTGAAPARHGVSSNTTFDPLDQNAGGWYWYAEDVRVPTLWDVAGARGLTTAAVHWPVTVGARLTWNLPQVWRAGTPDDRKLVRALATPGLVDSLERRAGVPYADGDDNSPEADVRRARFAARLLEWRRPAVTLAYFAGLDHVEHEFGPYAPQSLAALERVDAALDTVVRAARRAFGDRVLVAAVSDHGFAPTHTEVELRVALAAAGLLAPLPAGEDRVSAWTAAPWFAGGSAAVVLHNPADTAAERRTAAALAALAADTANGVARVLGRRELAALGGFPEAQFLVAFRAGYRVGTRVRGPLRVPAGGGWHGYLPEEPAMRAAFYVAGPGVAPGTSLGVVDMRDVAPTLAARLGLALPAAEGRDLLAPRVPRPAAPTTSGQP